MVVNVVILPVGGHVVSRVSHSSAPVGVAVLRGAGARVVLLLGSAVLLPDACPRVPLLACSVVAIPCLQPPTDGTMSCSIGEATTVEGVVLDRPSHHQSVPFVVCM